MSENRDEGISIIPIGGLGEFGMNMMVYEYGNDIIIIDAGLMFPEADMLGVDLVFPDLTYLTDNKDKIKGIIITHAHEDHVGGLASFLRQINVPVYGTKLTLALAKGRLREYNVLAEAQLNVIHPDDSLQLGDFKLEFIHVAHSIPDAVTVAIHTPIGIIAHISDFKFDQTPVDNRLTEIHKLTRLGEEGVLLLISDSTNADRPGFTPSERSIYHDLDRIFQKAERRLFLSTFSSSLHRIQQFIDLAVEHRRLIGVTGRSMIGNIRTASELGYLDVPHDLLIDAREVKHFEPYEVVVLSTGSQGEPRSAMALMAMGDHASLHLEPEDTVVISARLIPGNERSVGHMINHMLRRGAHVLYEKNAHVHVSGHGAQEDLKLMMNLVRPKFFVPMHGEYSNLVHHAELAETVGISPENITVAENGDRILLTRDSCGIQERVPAGRVFVDGRIDMGIEDIVLHDRQQLSQDGMVIPIVVLDSNSGAIATGPDIVSRGFVYMDESEDLMNEAKKIVIQAIDQLSPETKSEEETVQEEIRVVLRRFFTKKTDRRPMVLPVVMRV
ncbi:MAG: ribonuclease J [Candidatus Poribacteria bacterium]|nr:ribonuclease J [Candidatus Poribacteria bacterium]